MEDVGAVIKPQALHSLFQVTDTAPVPFEGKEFSNQATKGTWPESPAHRLKIPQTLLVKTEARPSSLGIVYAMPHLGHG